MSKRNAPTPTRPAGGIDRHGARVFDDASHDPYRSSVKYKEPAVCETCGVVLHQGRWHWAMGEPGAHGVVCPACRRARDKLPAGTLTLEGAFFVAHRTETMNLVRNEAERENEEHALNRILAIDEQNDRTIVSTTDIHLPQRIGRALERAWDGDLVIHHAKGEYSIDVRWRRD